MFPSPSFLSFFPSGTPLVNVSKFPSLKGLVDYGHSKSMKMGWYDNNCICMDEYTLQSNAAWAEMCYAGDMAQVVAAGFDGIKIDNCGDDQVRRRGGGGRGGGGGRCCSVCAVCSVCTVCV
jgi:hypothetical protein